MKPIKIEVKDLEIDLQNHTVSEKLIPGPKGEDGKDGETPTEEQLLALILPNIPKPKDGKDGKSITKTEVKEIIKSVLPEEKLIEKIVKKIPVPKDGEDGKSFRFADLTAYEKQILTGPPGSTGVGVPRGGTANQVLSKRSSRDFDTEWVTGGSGTVYTDGVTITGDGTISDPLVAVGDGTGDVHGPASAVNNNFAAFDLTTGKIIKDSGSSASSFATAAQGATADTALQAANISDTAYNATSWDGVTTIAPSKNAVRDKIETMDAAIALNTAKVTNANHTGDATGSTALTLATVNSNVGSFTNANITVNAKGLITAASNGSGGSGTVTSVTSANGDATVATTTTTPVITIVSAPKLTTARTIGTLTGDVTTAGSSFDGSANNTNATTVVKINGTSLAGLATGILKNTTATGVPSIAVAGDFPTLNQNTTGSAATLTTSRTIGTATGDVTSAGSSFNGSANNTNAYTIANSAVTLVKMADLAQDQFIGRTTASTGVPQTATITAAARTVLDDTTVGAMVDTLGGATSTGTGGLVRAGSPALTTPSIAAITVSGGILTLPTGASDTLVSKNSTDTLTNKSISGGQITSAVATATTATGTNALYSATTTVNVSSATAPSSGQVLTATSSTSATWQTPTGGAGWVTIGTGTLGSANATLMDVTSISSTYDTFRITICWLNSSSSSRDIWLRFNNDTAGNYSTESTFFSSSTITASRESGQSKIRLNIGQTVETSSTNHYTITVSKPTTGMPASVCFDGKINNTSSIVRMSGSAHWNNTSAKIDRIKIQDEDGTGIFDTGSFYILEGYVVT